ncbi:MAG: hypothetical protein Q4A25_01430 [Candidatus Saccharibacteria bacterium]|nr:hypothetical protein [Candidatus Saccharibacteria bacterium]
MEQDKSPEKISEKTLENLGSIAIEAKKILKAEALDDVKFFAKEYRNIENNFSQIISKKALWKNETEFKIWENDAAEAYEKMKSAEDDAGLLSNRFERDRVENISQPKVENTIEVYSGHFYETRSEALVEKLKNEPNSEETIEKVGSLHEYAAKHVEAVRNRELRATDVETWNRNCRKTHNELINLLNDINWIAKERNLTPLTFRNFETNDYYYDRGKDIGGYTDARAEYDRAIVEKYCETAFSNLGGAREETLTPEVATSILDFHRLGED